MIYNLIENGVIIKTKLPKSYTLKDGRTVTNYHLLPHDTLLSEGWLPVEDIAPEYDVETQDITSEKVIRADKVEVVYTVVDKPIIEPVEPEPSVEEMLLLAYEEIEALKLRLEAIENV
jgi:hypothetical protein